MSKSTILDHFVSLPQSLLKTIEHSLVFDYSSGGVTTVAPGMSIPWRTMPWLLTAQIARGSTFIEYADGRSSEIRQGSLCCVPPGVRHRMEHSAESGIVSLWSHVTVTAFGSLPLSRLVHLPEVLLGNDADRIGEINTELAGIALVAGPGLEQILKRQALGFELAAILVSRSEAMPNGLRTMDDTLRLMPVLSHIEEHLGDDLTRDQLAAVIHLSGSRFFALFRMTFGLSPGQYLQSARIRKAQQLLLTTELTIGEIGQLSGFTDQFHFSRTFKQINGVSPKGYRTQLRASLM